MPAFTAAVFVTAPRPMDNEHSLRAYALLYEGSRPHWELHIENRVFRFIPDPAFILEDALAQLHMYITMPGKEWQYDPDVDAAVDLSEELGEEMCQDMRDTLSADLSAHDLYYRIITWPGVHMPGLRSKVEDWKKAGAKIEAVAGVEG